MVAVLQPLKQGKVIPIDRAVVMVGRGSDCDAIITNSQKISRRHCCLVQVDNAYFIRDLGSMNGIWVNGKRVTRVSAMQLGDKVQIGDVEFQFHPNARIESKRTVVGDTPAPAKPSASGNDAKGAAAAPVADLVAEVIPEAGGDAELMKSDQIKLVDPEPDVVDDVKPVSEEEFEIIDDVVPLEQDDAFLLETNEVEVIDEPIIDDPPADADDEIVAAELVDDDLLDEVDILDAEAVADGIVDAEVLDAEILDAEILDAEIVESTSEDDDDEDEIIIFED